MQSRGRQMDNYDRTIIKRIAVVLLCTFIFVSFMPAMTYAFEEGQEQLESSVEAADIDISETETETTDLSGVDPETESPTDGLANDDTLLEGFMDSRLNEELGRPKPGSGMRKAAVSKRRNTLNDNEKYIYDALKVFIDKAAAGEASAAKASIDVTSVFSPYYTESGNYYVITRRSLGIESAVYIKKTEDGKTKWTFSDEAKEVLYDFNAVINALMADEPYAFYWYDKTEGLVFNVRGLLIKTSGDSSNVFFLKTTSPVLEVSFTVSEDYMTESGSIYNLDTTKTGAAAQAVANAARIIEDYDLEPDYYKLEAYKDEICALTSYNRTAANSQNYPYGDPWQMIYVFDGKSSTNVVCEGYAKAFQYLCDHSYFVYEIECDSVTGTMRGGTGAGGHMWNILHMNDGRNYIADITNSDTGTVGSGGGVFISPAMAGGSVAEGYQYDVYRSGRTDGIADLTYIYDEDTLELFSEDELKMSEEEYEIPPVMTDISYEWAEDNSRCTARGIWVDSGDAVEEDAEMSVTVKIPASCFEDGTTTYTAKFSNRYFRTQKKEIENIPAYGEHDWNGGTVTNPAAEGAEGLMTYTCTRCGKTRTEVIPAIVYPNDLPVVKISKPKAGKKKMTVRWKKVSKKKQKKIQGVEIQIATDKNFTNIVKKTKGSKKKTSKVIKGLKSKKRYYVRIRAYKNAADGKHVSDWKSSHIKVK